MCATRTPDIKDIQPRFVTLATQKAVATQSRLDPTMLSKAHDLVCVEGNILTSTRDENTLYINSAKFLVQDSPANKMTVRERVMPYENLRTTVIIT